MSGEAVDGAMRRYTFKLYPNVAQAAALEAQRRLHSALYNALIEQRIAAYTHPQSGAAKLRRAVEYFAVPSKKDPEKLYWRSRAVNVFEAAGPTLTAFDQGRELTMLRAEMPEYAALSRGSLEQTTKRVDLAFQAFFRRAKAGAGAESGFPRFKRCDGFGMREMSKGGWTFDGRRLRIQGVPGLVKARGKYPATPLETRTSDLRLDGGVWWLSVVVRMPHRAQCEDEYTGEVDFDLVDSFARVRRAGGLYEAGPEETVFTAADGRITPLFQGVGFGSGASSPETGAERREHFPLPIGYSGASSPETGGAGEEDGKTALEESEIQRIQRRMAACKRGSCRYRMLRSRKARLQARQARQRREALHLWTTAIVRQFAELTVIMPKIKDETASGRGDERAWGAAVEPKAALNRRVLDQAPALACAMLEYKMAERGGMFCTRQPEAPKVAVGADLVASGKLLRRAQRIIKQAKEAGHV